MSGKRENWNRKLHAVLNFREKDPERDFKDSGTMCPGSTELPVPRTARAGRAYLIVLLAVSGPGSPGSQWQTACDAASSRAVLADLRLVGLPRCGRACSLSAPAASLSRNWPQVQSEVLFKE